MKRSSTTLKTIATALTAMAITAAPAAASTGFGWLNQGTGGDQAPAVAQVGHSSINATLGSSVPQASKGQAGSDHTSINATLGKGQPEPSATPVQRPDYRSLNSIVGSKPTSDEPTSVVVRERNGFDWEAAMAGALSGLGLALFSLVTTRTLRRQRRISAQSRA